jgi:ATP-dependent DNA helicase RecG
VPIHVFIWKSRGEPRVCNSFRHAMANHAARMPGGFESVKAARYDDQAWSLNGFSSRQQLCSTARREWVFTSTEIGGSRMANMSSEVSAELVRLVDRIGIAVELGESHFREFKSALEGPPSGKKSRPAKDICVNISQTLVAFANADGGELLVGVEDDGEISGVDMTDEQISVLLDAPIKNVHPDTPLPQTRKAKVMVEGRLVVYFSVSKGTEFVHLTSDGRCLQRRDRESVPISSEIIRFTRSEVISREYDRQFVDGATLADLDSNLIGYVSGSVSKGMSNDKFLQHMELAEFDGVQFRIRRAALLLFGKNINKWHPRSQVRLLKINGTELKVGEEFHLVADDERSANIMELLDQSWEMLRPHLTETRFSSDARFRAQITYPELACREALVNAIAHRDYSIEGRGVEVRVFSDRMEIDNPGALLSTIRIEDLSKSLGVHQSRNSLVAKVLRVSGYMRELGEGMRRMFELMRSNDLHPPELKSDSSSFSVTLHHRYIYSREEKLWLDGFHEFGLSHDEQTVVRLGYNGHIISAKEIWDSVGIVDTEDYRKLLVSLQRKGLLVSAMSKAEVDGVFRRRKIPRKEIPRFTIAYPQKDMKSPRIGDSKSESVEKYSVVDSNDYARVYVNNLPSQVGKEDLLKFMSQFGMVVDSVVPRANKDRNKGYGFVEFADVAAAQKAIGASGTIEYESRRLKIVKAERKSLE